MALRTTTRLSQADRLKDGGAATAVEEIRAWLTWPR